MLGSRPSTRIAPLLVVLLVALAGCGGLSSPPADSPTASPTATATVTPTATPTATPTPTPAPSAAFPRGIDSTGVTNVTAVLATHRANVAATAGVVTHRTNASLAGRTVVSNVTAAATANLTRVRYESRSRTVEPNTTRTRLTVISANATNVSQHVVADGNVTLNNTLARGDTYDTALTGLATATSPLRGVLRRGNFTVTDVTETNGTRVVTLDADSYAESGRLYDPENVASYDATLRITADGTVLSANERIVGTEPTDGRYYVFDYAFAPGPVSPSPVGHNATTAA